MRYDAMGRAMKQSNPTEINGGWAPAGDDIAGVVYTQQTYDWQGRPLYTTNTDGTIKYASYSGCGCAGGEMVTLTDEVGRQQKVYSDVLGRQWKSEVLNWNGSVYSTTTNTLNALDQITNVRQTDNATGVYQDTVMTFDGYGRLASKHVPEQNAGTATVFAYNSDNTIQSITDARGARASYSYNNRHLVEDINYSAPNGITNAANASFSYDSAGNRTLMIDGMGSKAYSFDQLSRLVAETRTFTGLGAFTLSYDYNLAGELKRITDASNSTINYGYDSIGRLNGVTGSDNLVGGVAAYASSFQYRAWGALKTMTDGSSHTSNLLYNSRLQPTHFDLSGGVVAQNYEYHNDGRISIVHNNTDTNFDRSYTYDHLGRLTAATSGAEVNGIPYTSIPYDEIFGYDAFSNLNTRQSETWGTYSASDSANYTNNRRGDYGYDADGRVTTIDTRGYSFDGAGNQIQMTGQKWIFNHYVPHLESASFDGDGNKVSNTVSGVTTYYLTSSILGAVVAELNSSGQKVVGYVFAGGQLLATQSNNVVTFKHATPPNTSQYDTYSNVPAASRIELDPAGADIGLTGPATPDTGGGDGDIGGSHVGETMYAMFADFMNPNSGCVVDGFKLPCGFAMNLVNMGAAQVCPNNDCSLRSVTVNITYNNGDKKSVQGLIQPGILPDGYNQTWTGRGAVAAAGAWNAGVLSGGSFGAGVESLIDNWIDLDRPANHRRFAHVTQHLSQNDISKETERLFRDCVAIVEGHLTDQLANTIRYNNRSHQPLGLLIAHAAVESTLGTALEGLAGELGLFQLKPSTARGLGLERFTNQQLRDDFALNTRLGTTYLQQQIDAFGGDVRSGLGAYKQGAKSVREVGLSPRSQIYADAIQKCAKAIKR